MIVWTVSTSVAVVIAIVDNSIVGSDGSFRTGRIHAAASSL